MITLYVNYNEQFEDGGDLAEGCTEDDAWPHYEPEYYSFSVLNATLENVNPYHEICELAGHDIPDHVWIVTAIHSDGGTFRMSHGHGAIEAAFRTEEEAKVASQSIRDNTWKSPRGYKRWGGYFEKLEDVRVDKVEVLRS